MGGHSSELFHTDPDGAAAFSTPDGGWLYAFNSEDCGGWGWGQGGVGAIRFDSDGHAIDYRMVATQSAYNCGGGKTWWDTFLSCEKKEHGQVYEVDPYGVRGERMTLLGGSSGGKFESAAYYWPSDGTPTFYITEDDRTGALRRRFTPDLRAMENAIELVHNSDYSELLDVNLSPKTYDKAQSPGSPTRFWQKVMSTTAIRSSEGIDVANCIVFFAAKKAKDSFDS